MDPSANLLIQLHRFVRRQDENFTTEAMAQLLRHLVQSAPDAAQRVLGFLVGANVGDLTRENAKVTVDTQHHTPNGLIPDIRLQCPDVLAFVEVKVDSDFSDGQVESYLRELRADHANSAAKRLVTLTRYQAPDSLPDEVHHVRWYELASELDSIAEGPLPPESRFLIEQFTGFLANRGMALLRVRSEISQGLARFQHRHSVESIFLGSPHLVRSLDQLEDSDLKALRDLLAAMEIAVQESGVVVNALKLYAGANYGGWIGWKLDKAQAYFYVWSNAPEIVILQAYDMPIDPEKAEQAPGRVYNLYAGWRWDRTLDIASEDLGYFDLSEAERVDALRRFFEESYSIALTLA